MVTNKYLDRWFRNVLIQAYFMMISLFYLCILKIHYIYTNESFSKLDSLGLFVICIIVVILLRPWIWKVICKLFYEPDGRIEEEDQ